MRVGGDAGGGKVAACGRRDGGEGEVGVREPGVRRGCGAKVDPALHAGARGQVHVVEGPHANLRCTTGIRRRGQPVQCAVAANAIAVRWGAQSSWPRTRECSAWTGEAAGKQSRDDVPAVAQCSLHPLSSLPLGSPLRRRRRMSGAAGAEACCVIAWEQSLFFGPRVEARHR